MLFEVEKVNLKRSELDFNYKIKQGSSFFTSSLILSSKFWKLQFLNHWKIIYCLQKSFVWLFVVPSIKSPYPNAGPKVAYITSEACTVEWPGLRSMGQDNMFYILQMQSAFGRDQTFKEVCYCVIENQICRITKSETWWSLGYMQYLQIYRGPSTSYRVSGLVPSGEYRLKVCAVRQSKDSTNQELVGSFSQTTSFVTLAPKSSGLASSESVKLSTKSSSESGSSGLGLTDQQWAIALLICFTLFAILVACLAQHFISRHQQQHSGLGGESVMSSGSDPSIPSPITSTSEKRNWTFWCSFCWLQCSPRHCWSTVDRTGDRSSRGRALGKGFLKDESPA